MNRGVERFVLLDLESVFKDFLNESFRINNWGISYKYLVFLTIIKTGDPAVFREDSHRLEISNSWLFP